MITKELHMKQYVGRFPVNMGLTKKVNKQGWVIYRDPEIGLYAYNEEKGEEVNLLLWNETAKTATEKVLNVIRADIEEKEAEIAEHENWISTECENPTEEALRVSVIRIRQGF